LSLSNAGWRKRRAIDRSSDCLKLDPDAFEDVSVTDMSADYLLYAAKRNDCLTSCDVLLVLEHAFSLGVAEFTPLID
jgi:hypothetical protein